MAGNLQLTYAAGWLWFFIQIFDLAAVRGLFPKSNLNSIPISYNSKFPFDFEEVPSWLGISKSDSSLNHVESVVIVGALPRLDVCHFRWGEV